MRKCDLSFDTRCKKIVCGSSRICLSVSTAAVHQWLAKRNYGRATAASQSGHNLLPPGCWFCAARIGGSRTKLFFDLADLKELQTKVQSAARSLDPGDARRVALHPPIKLKPASEGKGKPWKIRDENRGASEIFVNSSVLLFHL